MGVDVPNSTCPAPDCERTPTNGYLHCGIHHRRLKKYGSYDMPSRPSREELFWAKVEKTDECWNWIGAKNDRGYGQIRFDNRIWYAHRLSYEWAHGAVGSLQIDHMCHNRACVNPAHLRPVTNKENQENSRLPKNNTSGARGVTWDRRRSKWTASVMHNYRSYHAGAWDTVEEAAEAARAMRFKLFTHNDVDMM